MKYYCIIFLLCMTACTQKTKPANKNTIPEARIKVSKNPVVSYLIPMGNPKLERKFGVEIYETPYTFKYLLVMQYDGMIQTDTLKVPNFGISPVVEIKPGTEKLSCIIGFLDGRNNFREYKMLSAKNEDLKLTVLKRYVVSGH